MSGVFEYPEEVVYERVAAHKALVAERDELRATVARVEALADEWEATLSVAQWRRQAARRLRKALVGESDG